MKGPTHSFYFGGDTGYNKIAFQQIGKKYGPFSLSALPIGAYEPRLSTFDKHDTQSRQEHIAESVIQQFFFFLEILALLRVLSVL